MDQILGFDMQKDTVIQTIRSVSLHPEGRNSVVVLDGIRSVTVNGQELGLGGYLDIGLIDTMKDLIVNFIGAVVFSCIGFVYVKNRGKGRLVRGFVPSRKKAERDFLRIAQETEAQTKVRTQARKFGQRKKQPENAWKTGWKTERKTAEKRNENEGKPDSFWLHFERLYTTISMVK